jgi:hypothetical protein
VTRVYLDPGTAIDNGTLDPAALRSLGHLVEAGHELVLVGGAGGARTELATLASHVVAAVPPRPDVEAWYLTEDVDSCQQLTARVRTVLIGASPPAGSVHRCDTVARSVQAAIMEILAAEAMTGATRPELPVRTGNETTTGVPRST